MRTTTALAILELFSKVQVANCNSQCSIEDGCCISLPSESHFIVSAVYITYARFNDGQFLKTTRDCSICLVFTSIGPTATPPPQRLKRYGILNGNDCFQHRDEGDSKSQRDHDHSQALKCMHCTCTLTS